MWDSCHFLLDFIKGSREKTSKENISKVINILKLFDFM